MTDVIRLSEPAVGIDLGTTLSVIARLDESGKPCAIRNAEGDVATPSAVYFHDAGAVVGKEALKAGRFEPEAFAQYAKRDMGKSEYHRRVRGQRVPPELVQALVLRQLKQEATLSLGEFRKVVITVPAYFNEPRRKATMDAGVLAGLEVLDIINEPTAAAVAYGVREGFLSAAGRAAKREQILVYDLGGGTFDATLMEIDGCRFRALATDGDVHLGGIDWDERIAGYVADQFREQFEVDWRNDPTAWQCLLQEAEDAKRALTSRSQVVIHFAHEGRRASLPLSAVQLESLTADLVDRTIFTVRSLLAEAGLKWSDLTRILLVGGSSRMPMVQKALQRETGATLDRSMLAEEPVAMGAALYAGILLGGTAAQRPEIVLQNISSHHLGVLGLEAKTGLPRRKVLIPRNQPLPAVGAGVFRTRRDNQSSVMVNVVEGGDDSGKNATHVGRCLVSGLPPQLRAGTPVKVSFAYGSNGRLTVTATLPGVQTEVAMTIERPAGMSENALQQWRRWIESGAVLTAAPAQPAAPPGQPRSGGAQKPIATAQPPRATAAPAGPRPADDVLTTKALADADDELLEAEAEAEPIALPADDPWNLEPPAKTSPPGDLDDFLKHLG